MVPIWKRKKSEVTDEEYNEFYKSDFHDFVDPLRTMSVHAEGMLTYDALLFIPGRQPYDLFSPDYKKGLALYSSNVLIMEKCEDLLPDYFGFVRGVVASEDLTLNISRETLQHNTQLRAIAKKVEKKIKSELADMRDKDRDAYEGFFKNFGRNLKFGIYSTYGQAASTLSDLLLFYSAKQEKLVTLDEYVDAMLADQEAIYYAAGNSVERLAKLPVVRSVLDRGFDVLLCAEDVDELCLQSMFQYKEKEFKNVSGGNLGLETEDEKAAAEAAAKDNEALFAAMKDALGEKVTKVSVSTRLTTAEAAPACITAEGPVSLEMEKLFAGMPVPEGGEAPRASRVLEVNAANPVFEVLKAAQEAEDADKVKLYADVLYNQALLVEGMPLEDPVAFANEIAQLMK
jgi:molecular chaperone HtpG